jgi:hypothetical protein
MRGEAVAGLLVVAILVGAGVGYLSGNAGVRTVTSVSTTSRLFTTTSILTTTTLVTATAYETTTLNTATSPTLEIIAGVSPTVITSGQNVTVNWGIYNPLPLGVEVSVSAYTNPYLSPCPISEVPTTFYIYSGHLSFTTLSSSTPRLIYNQSLNIECFAGFNSTLVFEPHSDRATVNALGSSLTANMNYTAEFSGYWVILPSNGGIGGPTFQKFPQGEYTVLFNDTWGQQELRYFTVNP